MLLILAPRFVNGVILSVTMLLVLIKAAVISRFLSGCCPENPVSGQLYYKGQGLNPKENTIMKNIFLIIFLFCARLVWSDIHEYQLLWEDVANAMTFGYKSHFDITDLTGKPNPSKHITALIETNESWFAIIGPTGFFKIVLDDTTIGYTRNGQFNTRLDLKTETYKLVTQGYTLADPVFLYTQVIKRDKKGQEEILGIIEGNDKNDEEWKKFARSAGEYAILFGELHGPKIAEQLKVYDVPYEKLRYYKDGIYILDPSYTGEIMESPNSLVVSNALEMSNVLVLEVLTRMYYLTVTDKSIKDRLFKAELLRIGIEQYAQTNETVEQSIMTLNNNVQEFIDKKVNQNSPSQRSPIVYEQLWYQSSQSRYRYIQRILPFIRYDY